MGEGANHPDHAMAAHAQVSNIVEKDYTGHTFLIRWFTKHSADNDL
jgi:hypothetical protein